MILNGILIDASACKGEVKIPDTVKEIGEYAFATEELVDEDGGIWTVKAGGDITSVIIPDSVKKIDKCAFYYCDKLTGITIPDSVKSIGQDAFSNTDKQFIIQCSFGSYAEEYARKNKIKYQLV